MRHLNIFIAVLVLTCFAFAPAAVRADDFEDLEITMEVFDGDDDIDSMIEMRGPEEDGDDYSEDDYEEDEREYEDIREDVRERRDRAKGKKKKELTALLRCLPTMKTLSRVEPMRQQMMRAAANPFY